jgi:hypothetical protein
MALRQRGKYRYGESQADIREELQRYSQGVTYLAHHFADARCQCGGKLFRLVLDDSEGAAVRTCAACRRQQPVGDSADYLHDAQLEQCTCPCGGEVFEVTAAVSLYRDSEDVKWFYIGCRCPECGLMACYGDWKNEYIDYHKLLAQV